MTAGDLTFSGTTEPFTLTPPYSYTSPSGITVLPPDATTLSVSVSGAAFPPGEPFGFDYASPARPVFQSLPSGDEFFGSGEVNIDWTPGESTANVTLMAGSEQITCTADDQAGTITIPRAVLDYITEEAESTQLARIAVERRSRHIEAGLPLVGTNDDDDGNGNGGNSELEPDDNDDDNGWLGLDGSNVDPGEGQGTASGSTAGGSSGPFSTGNMVIDTTRTIRSVVANCTGGESLCGSVCVDTNTDPAHCGGCDNSCDAGDQCHSGSCVAPCQSDAECSPQVCDFGTGMCEECLTNADCPGGACHDNSCVDCLHDADCPGATTCNLSTYSCEGCTDDSHCDNGYCDPDTASCANCVTDAHCPEIDVCTDDAQCAECDQNRPDPDADCPGDQICGPGNQCGECFDDTECPDGSCEDNICVSDSCLSKSECASDEVCIDETCQPPTTDSCASDDHCLDTCDQFGDCTCDYMDTGADSHLCAEGHQCIQDSVHGDYCG